MIVVGVSIVFSANQPPPPGLQDSMEPSEEVIVQLDAEKTDTVETSEKVVISEQSAYIENDNLNYYIDEKGVKHYVIEIEDTGSTTG